MTYLYIYIVDVNDMIWTIRRYDYAHHITSKKSNKIHVTIRQLKWHSNICISLIYHNVLVISFKKKFT